MAQPNPLVSGLRGRCPNCGEGALFAGFLKVAPQCSTCGYDLGKADSGEGPAVFVILIAGFWRGNHTGLILAGSAASALLVHHVVPGVWYILGGALGGVAMAALATRRAREVRT